MARYNIFSLDLTNIMLFQILSLFFRGVRGVHGVRGFRGEKSLVFNILLSLLGAT